jgi:hypothetical protein
MGMSEEDRHYRTMRELGAEWGASAAVATLARIEAAAEDAHPMRFLLDLDREVRERAASLVVQGLDEVLAGAWEEAARDAIEAWLAGHDLVSAETPDRLPTRSAQKLEPATLVQ